MPDEVLSVLRAHDHVFAHARYFSQILEVPELRAVAEKLDSFVLRGNVRVYHCAKELYAGTFAAGGLRTLSLDAHITQFMTVVGALAPRLYDEFESTYQRWRQNSQISSREGRISFCLTRDLVISDGTKRFFTYYGGEALYWPFPKGHACLSFLQSLGQAVVVEVDLPARDLTVFSQLVYAKLLIGYYAQHINPDFEPEDMEAQIRRPVLPAEVVEVFPKDVFFNRHDRRT